MKSNKIHCWGFAEGESGDSWTKGYCYGPTENPGREFCSNMVTDPDLKTFTCPIDATKCPSGSNAIIMNTKFDTESSISDSWSRSRIRQLTHCKIQVKHNIFSSGLADKAREHIMYIHHVEATQAGQVQIMELINGDYRTSTISNTESGEIRQIKMNVAAGPFGAIRQDKEWWVLYDP